MAPVSDVAAPDRSRTGAVAGNLDAAAAGRMGALVFLVAAALTALLVVLVPPTALGAWGWGVAAVGIGVRLAAAARLATGNRPPLDPAALYVVSAVGIVSSCLLQFLATNAAFYHDLVLIDLVYVAALHTRRRTAFAVVLAVAGMVPALVRSGEGHVSVAEWGAEAVLWSLVAGLVVIYADRSRRERARLRQSGERAEALARVDALTGLGNRRAFDETLDAQLALSRRYGTPLSIIAGDLDGFKAINDRQGHAAGDKVLRHVARSLTETIRRPDACFRWGGDEFAIVLPQTSGAEARVVADRVRHAVAVGAAESGSWPVTITLGVAELDGVKDAAELLAEADQALLDQKRRRGVEPRRGWRFGRAAGSTARKDR